MKNSIRDFYLASNPLTDQEIYARASPKAIEKGIQIDANDLYHQFPLQGPFDWTIDQTVESFPVDVSSLYIQPNHPAYLTVYKHFIESLQSQHPDIQFSIGHRPGQNENEMIYVLTLTH